MEVKKIEIPVDLQPFCNEAIELPRTLFNQLRKIMTERNEIEKFITWQKTKFIRITDD